MNSPRPARLLLSIALAACQPAGSPGTAAPPGAVTVITVLDGDTLEVEGPQGRMVVRLDGVNAPESDECYHREAGDHLTRLVATGVVVMETTGTDQFGRTLGHLHVDGTHVNLDLVTGGYAVATTPVHGAGSGLIEAEAGAAAEGVGLWGREVCGTGPIPRIEIDFERSVVDPPGPDDEMLDQELIVLVNGADAEVDLDGWVLRDESSRHRYHFPTGARLAPGGSLTVTSADPGWTPGGSPVWNNGGDLILLLDGSGRVVARLRYWAGLGVD